MNDISKDKDHQEFPAGIKELAKGLMQIRERAAIEYAPVVEEFCTRKHATANEVGRMLDYLFEFADDERILLMYKKVCRRFVYDYPDTISYMVKYNVMKKKVAVLEDTVEKLEQERAAAMSQAVDEERKRKIQETLGWFAEKISTFSKEEQEAINACAITFAKRDQIVIPQVEIAVNTKCSQADLMSYASSAFFKIGKRRKDIAQFLSIVFKAYFPGGESFVHKKMPGVKQ